MRSKQVFWDRVDKTEVTRPWSLRYLKVDATFSNEVGQHLEGRGRQYPKPHPLTVDGQHGDNWGQEDSQVPHLQGRAIFFFTHEAGRAKSLGLPGRANLKI